jgi:pimeloyl-ACP methyl ester carboxylesterase
MKTMNDTGFAAVNGLKLYYEIHGSGEPLIALHGGLGSTAMFSPILPALAREFRVIAVDLQAHGRTADIDRPMRLETMAEDIAALMQHLGLQQADLIGYSLGGGVALRLAIQHPKAVRKLVLISTPCKKSGWYPEIQAGMAQMSSAAAEMMKPSPIYAEYARVAPRPADWPNLLDKIGDLLKRDYDCSPEIASIQATPMLVFGDADSVVPSHVMEFYQLLGGGLRDAGWDRSGMSAARLAILPGATHYDILTSPLLAPTVEPFLTGK